MSSNASSKSLLSRFFFPQSSETTINAQAELENALADPNARIVRNGEGGYSVTLPSLEVLEIAPDSPLIKLLLAALPFRPEQSEQNLTEENKAIGDDVAESETSTANKDPLDPSTGKDEGEKAATGDGSGVKSDATFQSPYSTGNIGPGLAHLNPLGDSDLKAGHDIERDQVGLNTEFDSSLQLSGVPDGDFLSNGIGSGLAHLVPLGDTEYAADLSTHNDPLSSDIRSGPAESFAVNDTFQSSESGVVTGNLFANDVQPNAVSSVALVTAPISGVLSLNPNGTFEFTPAPNFSGKVTFTYSFYDTATGQTKTATGEICIAAVAQAPIVSGGVTALEDSGTTPLPITVELQDKDGSEFIESVKVEGVPADVGFSWTTSLPGTVTDLGGGAYQFGGTTEQIQALLNSIAVTPTPDSDPKFDLTVTATSRDTNPADQGGVAVPTATTVHKVPVTITAVADAPTVSTNSTTGREGDTLSFGKDITYSLNDTDGSESVTGVSLGNFPAGAAVNFTATGGATVSFVGGVYQISGTPAAIRATLDTFTVNLGTDSDKDFNVSVSVTVTDTGGVQATTTNPHGIHVSAVADTPSGTGSASGNEDTAIPLNLVVGLNDPDGSEAIDFVDIAGLPTGGTFTLPPASGVAATLMAGGVWRFTGDTADIIAALKNLTATPPSHSDGDFNLTVTVQAIESNPTTTATGNSNETSHVAVPTAATNFVIPVSVAAIADKPTVSAPATPYVTNEDTSVSLTGLGGALVDTDGSETHKFEISSVPTGGRFSNSSGGAVGTETSPGMWAFTPTEIAAGLTFNPPADVSGTFDMTLTSIATETDPAAPTPTASSNVDFTVNVAGVADAPTVTGSSSGDEDTVIGVGANIDIVKTDTDGSEALTSVVINNIPATATIDFTVEGSANVSGTPTTLTITGSEADIRATLATFTLTPPAHSDADIDLKISATITDTGGDTKTTAVDHKITVGAIADEAVVSGGVTINEDATATIAVPVTAALQDTDGSEAISNVTVSGIPSDVTLGWDTGVGGTVTAKPAGNFEFSGTTKEIQDLLASLTVTPPQHGDVSFEMSVDTTVTETTPSEAGGVTTATATNTTAIPVVINAVADKPTGSGAGSDREDAVVDVPITVALTDTDGSETLQSVVISGVPTGWTPATASNSVYDPAKGTVTVTGTDAEIKATLAAFTMKAPIHSDDDVKLSVAVTSIESNPDNAGQVTTATAETTFDVDVTIAAVADTPNVVVSTNAFTTNEDVPIVLTGFNGSLVDTDGSEQLTFEIHDVPAGASFNVGTQSATDPTVWTFSATDIKGDGINPPTPLTFTPATHWHGTINMELVSIATEVTGPQIAVETATSKLPFSITVEAIADTPTVSAPATPYTTNEDTSVALPGLGGALVDTDGSETLAFQVSNVPTGGSFSNNSGGAVGTQTSPGVWAFTTAEIAAGLTFNPPENVSGAFVMTLTSTATETAPDAPTPTASNSTDFTVEIASVADKPTITGSSSGDEDTMIAVGTNIAITKNDTDGSEALTSVVINNIPAAATIDFTIDGSANVSGTPTTLTITGTEDEIRNTLASLKLTPPANSDADINLSISATTTDTGGVTATTTVNHAITVSAIADEALVSGGVTVDEDATATIAVPVPVALQDTDGTEAVTKIVITGVPTDVTLGWNTTVGGTVTAKPDDSYEFTGSSQEIIDLLASLTVTPPEHGDTSFEMSVETTVTETMPTESGDVTTATATNTTAIPVVINAVADAPTGSGAGSEREDAIVDVPITVALVDTDGSETLQSAVISGIPTGWTPATASNSVYDPAKGTVTVTGTDAEIKATLAAFTLQLPPHSDDDAKLSVTVTSIESSPDNAGQVTTSTAATTFDVDVIVAAVADTPSIAVTTNAFTTNEDTPAVLTGFNGGLVDTDGSEELTFEIHDVPTGATFNIGTQSATDPTIWTFSATDIKGDGVNPPTPISFTPPAQWHGTINMSLVSIATEVAGPQIAVETASATLPFSITVDPILDVPVVNNSSSSVNEDTTIPLGDDLDISLVDVDGSQDLIVTLDGFPTPATPAWNTALPGTVDQPTPGTLVITGATPAEVLALVDSLTVTETSDLDKDFSLSITAKTTETGGATTTVSGTHTVNVKAVADKPSESTPNQLGNEDTTVDIPVGVTLNDTDGSETIQEARIYNIPADATLGYTLVGTAAVTTSTHPRNGTLRFDFTGDDADIQATLATLNIRWNDPHKSDDIIVRLRARSEETTPSEVGDIAVAVATTYGQLRVDFDPVADTPTVTISDPSYTGIEDQPVALVDATHNVDGSLVDTDGSETLSFQVSGVPTGGSFTTGTQSPTDPTVWLFTPAELANAGFLNPPNEHGTFNMVLTSVATEADDGRNNDETDDVATNSTPFSVTIGSTADGVTITGGSTTLEDQTVTFGPDIVIKLIDGDGSEEITAVTLDLPDNYIGTYTATGTASVVETSPGVYRITGDEADIQATIDTFTMTPGAAITHSDDNVSVNISVASSDISGLGATTNGTHEITIKAVADAPVATANDVVGLEDTAISLDLSGALTDTDGSEFLSKAILTLADPNWAVTTNANGTVTKNSDGSFDITADTPTNLASVLASVTIQAGEHFSGVSANATLQLASTETATGGELETKIATSVADTFNITVGAVADTPTLETLNSTGGAAGFEDTPIKLTIRSSLIDQDGSEVLTVELGDVPTGATFVDGSNTVIGTNLGGGKWLFTEAQLADLHIIPPPHDNDDFTLTVKAIATEATLYSVAGEVETATSTGTIDVEVIGVADKPDLPIAVVSSPEDTPITLGASLLESTADADGSETLSYIISGLPTGVIPSHGKYIGGSWQVSATDILSLTIPVPENFAGDYIATYAPSLKVEVVTQEDDGNQLTTIIPMSITVTPVLDAVASVGGSVEVNEGGNISLSNAAVGSLIDGDGSESIASYTFDLNSVAGLDPTVAPSINDFIAGHISGSFVNNGDGTITVQPGDLSGITLQSSAFTDSNVDFGIPMSVTFVDPGASGSPGAVNGNFSVTINGVADIPTVFADNVAGAPSGGNTAVNIGGTTTDTDAALGRAGSETIHYIVSGLPIDGSGIIAFTNSAGDIVGLNNGNGTWYLQPSDLADLHIASSNDTVGTHSLTLTTFATENDGSNDQATNSTSWDVEFVPGTGGAPTDPPPIKPILTINPMVTDEDGSITVAITAVPDPVDMTAPSISVVFSDLSPGATISGAIYNPATDRWFVDAANLGSVVITPDPNFAGDVTFNVEAVATNASLQSDATGEQPASVTVTPVADGPRITAAPFAGSEDGSTALNIAVTLQDTDAASPEALSSTVQITLSEPTAQLLDSVGNAYAAVGGVYTVPVGDVGGLRIQPSPHLHGTVTATISAESYETLDASSKQTTVSNVSISFEAVADAPNATVQNVTGDEDTAIELSGLSATLVDTDGSEDLSITISGIPVDSILSAGSNNGDGTWTLTSAQLAGLTLTPPRNYSGVLNLALNAYSLETSNADVATTSLPFTVTVNPIADSLRVDPTDQTVEEGSSVPLTLNIVMDDDSGVLAGETPAETVELTFTRVPIGSTLTATAGGTLVDNGGGQWIFAGTATEAGNLTFTGGTDLIGEHTISLSSVAIDGSNRGAAVASQFNVSITAAPDLVLSGTLGADTLNGGGGDDTISGAAGMDTLSGLTGADTLNGGEDSDILDGGAGSDTLIGGIGADMLTGGDDADIYVWQAGDDSSGTDVITDFNVAEGDKLDLQALLPGFDDTTDDISDFVQLSEAGGSTTVQIDATGSGTFATDVVSLDGITGLDLTTLYANGNIIA